MPAVRKPTIHSAGKRSKVLPRISSLLKKPARGGIPAMARAAIKKVRAVAGIFPHSAPILLAGERVDHAAGTEEEERFEERVGHQVENSRRKGAHAEGEKHIAELADGGIGENSLDIVLHQAH